MTKQDPAKSSPRVAEQPSAPQPERRAEDTEREPADHLGATETEIEKTTPPMRGPADLVGETDEDDDDMDPADELTPG
jgi:hypothetical protein